MTSKDQVVHRGFDGVYFSDARRDAFVRTLRSPTEFRLRARG